MNSPKALMLMVSLSIPLLATAKDIQKTQPVSAGTTAFSSLSAPAIAPAPQPIAAPTPVSASSAVSQQAYQKALADNQALVNDLMALQEQYDALKNSPKPKASSSEIEALKKQTVELDRKLRDSQTTLKDTQNAYASEQSKYQVLASQKSNAAELDKKLQAQNEQIKAQLQQINDLKTQNIALSKEAATKYQALNNEKNALQSEFNTYKANQEKNKTPNLTPENQALKAKVANLESEINKVNQQKLSSQAQSQSQAKSVTELQTANSAQKTQIATLQTQVSNLEQALKVEQSKAINNPLIAENDSLKKQLKASQDKLAAAQANAPVKLSPEQENQRGLEIFRFGDYDGALPYFRRAADADNPGGLTNLAMMYLNGYGVEPSMRQTEALLRRASSLGSAVASENLAKIYQNALGVGYNPAKAIYWYQIALKQGSTTAAEQLRVLGAKSS